MTRAIEKALALLPGCAALLRQSTWPLALALLVFSHLYAERAVELATFRPAPLAPDAPELAGIGRGLFKWNDQAAPYTVPLPRPEPDVYHRFDWRELEPAKDQYDFSRLDALADEARARGGKFMFRINAFCTAWCPEVAVPDYFLDHDDPDYLPGGWRYHHAYVPDWNDPHFLDRAEKLLQALGRRYGGDPRLGVVQIGLYGNWGEWHTWPLRYPSPTGAQDMTAENQRRLIDMHARAFPNTQLVMMRGGKSEAKAVVYAMGLGAGTDPPVARPIGWAADCWADPAQEDDLPALPQWPAMRDRWRVAPVMGEICGTLDARSPNWPVLPRHVADYHISLLGNGNIGGDGVWVNLPKHAQEQFRRAGNLAGYRYALTRLSLPARLRPGSSFTVTSAWSNRGVAPIYEPWQVLVQLRDPADDRVVWEGRSRLDLRQLLPADGPVPALVDTFLLPAGLAPGRYDVTVQVRDITTDYRAPLPLAIEGRRADGSYELGSTLVAGG